jgi:hypothetical protein
LTLKRKKRRVAFFFGLECALYVMRRAVQMPESLIKRPFSLGFSRGKNLDGWPSRPYTSAAPNPRTADFDPVAPRRLPEAGRKRIFDDVAAL